MANQGNDISLSALKIISIYLVVTALWIAFSDQLLDALVIDPEYLSTAQTYKGWIYVALTSLGLFYLIKRHDRQITEKEEKISELSEKFKLERELSDILFERIPVLINIYDPDLEEFRINKEFEKVTGWTNEEVQEINFMEACFPDLEVRKEVAEFMEKPGIGWKEFPLSTKSGEQLSTSWTNIKLTDDTSVGIGIDMTEIKANQAKLRESREVLRKTFESLEESIILVDPETRTIADCNKGTEKIFGYTQQELIGESTRKLHVSDSTFDEFDQMGKQSLEEKGVFKTEFLMQKKDGSTFHSGHTVTLVYDKKGEVDKVVSVIRDISKQKQYQKRLKERKEFIETTLENLPIGVSVNTIDDGETTFINEKFTEIYGWPAEDLDSVQNFFEHVYADKDFREKMKKKVMSDLESGDPERMDWTKIPITTKEGKRKYVNNKAIPLYKQNLMISTVVDVTEQHKYEEKLKHRQERLLRSQKIAQIGDWEFNPKTEKISWSPTMFEIFEHDPDLAPPSFEEIKKQYYGDDSKKHNNAVKRALEEGISYDIDLRLQTGKGNQKYIRAIGIPVEDESGDVEKLLGIVQDITERKQVEKELAKEKQRFQLVAQTTSDVIWDLDLTDNTIWWSKGFEDHFGYDRSKLADDLSSWSNHIHPEDKARATESLEKAINGEDKFWQEQYRFKLADGSTAHIIDQGIIIRDAKEEAVRMVGTLNNITERVEAEQKLRESEEKYRHIFDNNPEPMWIYNPDTLEFVEINKAAVNHYGYSEDEFLNMTLADIRPDKEVEKLKAAKEKHKSKKSYFGEWKHLKKNDSLIHVEVYTANAQYKNETYRLALIHDITEQKRMQEKIIQSVIEGENRERKRIALELHDGLGQYLVAANMNFQSVQEEVNKLPEKREKQFQTGLSHLQKALSETRSIAHNLMPKAITDYGLVVALKNLIEGLRDSTDIGFSFDYNCKNLRLHNRAEVNIYRILQEIISNAVRHSECSEISIALKETNNTLQLTVEDNGKGAELDAEDDEEEQGLGLRSIKTRVKSLNGSLEIKTEPQKGMKTFISIPDIDSIKQNGET